MKTFKEFRTIKEQRVDKHEVSGKVVIDGHVFNDHGKVGRSTYGRYSTKDPDYVKDTKEVGRYKKPSSINFDTLAKAKSWVKTRPKKSASEIEAIHKKHADFEKEMNESIQKEDYENPYRFDWGTPEGTAYMKKMTPKMKFEPMYNKDCKCNTDSLPATKKIISPSQ